MHFNNYGSYLILSHFKGHAMAGFGGAIKNVSIGIGARSGKNRIHTAGKSDTTWRGGDQDAFTEAMAQVCKSVSDALNGGKKITYINVMNRLSIDCDCNGNPAEADIHDIGILGSNDPVALDQACVDMIKVVDSNESFVNRITSQNGIHALEYGEAIGLEHRNYRLVFLKNK